MYKYCVNYAIWLRYACGVNCQSMFYCCYTSRRAIYLTMFLCCLQCLYVIARAYVGYSVSEAGTQSEGAWVNVPPFSWKNCHAPSIFTRMKVQNFLGRGHSILPDSTPVGADTPFLTSPYGCFRHLSQITLPLIMCLL